MSKGIRDKFNKDGKVNIPPQSLTLSKPGVCGSGSRVGQKWDYQLSKIIQQKKERKLEESSREQPEFLLLEAILKEFDFEIYDSHFPLYGYMYSKTERQPRVYFWEGDADAIGWYTDPTSGEGRYVIVDWKVASDIATFWEKNPDAYGRYLHQCLVYARLLKLHMNLAYLPLILIVAISTVTGRDFHPALFIEYPVECTEFIEDFEWSVTFPEQKREVQIIPEKLLNAQILEKGRPVEKKMPLVNFFSKDATVEDLMELLELPASIQVV